MDILHISEEKIETMEYIDYHEALNYAVTTYRLRNMAGSEEKKQGDTVSFDQPEDYDIDPNFISRVN